MPATAGQRTDQAWLADLGSASEDRRSAAHRDLLDFLRRGLGRALSRRASVDDASLEDFAQEAALRVLDRLDTFRGDSRFTTWALSIALRVAFTELRRRRWKDVSLDQFGEDTLTDRPAWPRPSLSPEAEAHRKEVVDILYSVINHELTPRQRSLLLAELGGVPLIVIEERLGSNRNALYKLGHDARKRLLKALAEAGITAGEVREAFA